MEKRVWFCGHSRMQDLITISRKTITVAANAAIDTLDQQRDGAVQRMMYFCALTGDNTSIIPMTISPFQELVDTIDPPSTDGRLTGRTTTIGFGRDGWIHSHSTCSTYQFYSPCRTGLFRL